MPTLILFLLRVRCTLVSVAALVFTVSLALSFAFVLPGCPLEERSSGDADGTESLSKGTGPGPESISVMTWNTQTFFDAEETGSEFEEFTDSKSKWSAERYGIRLDRLCETLLTAGRIADEGPDRGADIVVLEEIENARVIEDLCNRLPQRNRYLNVAFVPPEEGGAFASAVLSRYPIRSVTAHSVASAGISVRPLLEVMLDAEGRSVSVFAAHWKSKSGDGDTARIRRAQERVLASRIASLETADLSVLYVACGDFNQGLEAFEILGKEKSESPWPDWLARCSSGQVSGPEGSYRFDGAWERIDHFFFPAEGLCGYRVRDFQVMGSPPLTDEDENPARYEVFSGSGYSDHLPLILVLARMN